MFYYVHSEQAVIAQTCHGAHTLSWAMFLGQ